MAKRFRELVSGVGEFEIKGEGNPLIEGLAIDSRKIDLGYIFFAIRGISSDGHNYIENAIISGAVAIVCEKLPDTINSGIVYIRVTDSSYAAGVISSEFYNRPSENLKLIGITGTNGKTTTATLLYRTFRYLGYGCGLISTVNYLINDKEYISSHTTPDQIRLNQLLSEMVEAGCDYCFMEVSSHSVVQNRIAGLNFLIAVFTNLTHDHLDYHNTFSEYLKAKKSFFDKLGGGAIALINKDDRNSSVMVQNSSAKVKTFGLKTMADYRGSIVEKHPDSTLLKFDGSEVWVKFIGSFNASNLLAVYSVSRLLEAEKEVLLSAISSLTPVEGRFETFRSNSITAIVDYAHTPDALNNVIEAIRQLKGEDSKLITVVGAGGDRDRSKRPLMASIAAEGSERVVFTSDNPRSEDPQKIIDEMLTGVKPDDRHRVISVVSRREAIRAACMMANSGDFVLVAGKGHETYQEINGVRGHFDDREEVKAIFEFFNSQIKS